MRSTRFAALLASLTLTSMLAIPAMAQDESPAADASAAPAAAEPVRVPATQAPYIPIVSKGFQHQFWQAVKKGAEDEGAALNANGQLHRPGQRVRCRHPDRDAAGRVRQEPGCHLLRCPRQPGRQPAAGASSRRRASRSSPSTPASTATSRSRRPPRTTWPLRHWPLTRWPRPSAAPARSASSSTTRPAAPASTAARASSTG